MSRGRSGTKSLLQRKIKRQNLNTAQRGFTRMRAERAINASNCSEDRFVKHRNKHVRAKAARLAGVVPEEQAAE